MINYIEPDNVSFVVKNKLCCGCGACVLVCNSKCIKNKSYFDV